MVSRRGLVAGAASVGAVLLSGCVPWSLQRRVNRAAETVEGVDSSDLSVGPGGTFNPQITGEIHCAVGTDELEGVLDAAWQNVVTLLHEGEDGDREVGSVGAIGSDGSEIGVSMWIPEGERNHIAVRDFYERYGLG